MTTTLFQGFLVSVSSYRDTKQTKVVVRITHAAPDGDIADLKQYRLVKPVLTSFRLKGENALDRIADGYRQWLEPWQEIRTRRGGIVYFTGQMLTESRDTYKGEPLVRLVGFSPDSLSFHPRAKQVVLEYVSQPALSGINAVVEDRQEAYL